MHDRSDKNFVPSAVYTCSMPPSSDAKTEIPAEMSCQKFTQELVEITSKKWRSRSIGKADANTLGTLWSHRNMRRLQRLTSAGALILAALMASGLAAILIRLSGSVPSMVFRPLRIPGITASNLVQRLAFVIILGVVLLVWRWRDRLWRRVALTALGICSVLTLVIVARPASATWPVADSAFIELYTIYATRGQQLLGAYSQYGWHHPGPLLFYLLVPFYVLGSPETVSLNAGALAINLASLLTIAWILWRERERSATLAIALVGFMLVYLFRARALLTSAWNPHVVVLPFTALVMLAAAFAAGNIRLLPFLVLFASFVCQAHIALVPVAGGIVIASLVSVAISSVNHPVLRRALVIWAKVSAWLLALLWMLPLAEELTETPGNMTWMWRFFFAESRPAQPLAKALRGWADLIVGVMRPDFFLAQGWALRVSPGQWPVVVAMLEMAAILAAAVWTWRSNRRFHFTLSGLCLLASAIAFWSATRIFGEIPDYDLFWVSALGVIDLTVVLATLAAVADEWLRTRSAAVVVTAGTGILLVVIPAALGFTELRASVRRSHAAVYGESEAVQVLTKQIAASLDRLSIRKPRFSIDEPWGIAAGVLLQLRKANIAFAVDAPSVRLYGRPLSANGGEDAVLTFCGSRLHDQMVLRPHNVVVANYGPIFVDGIKLAGQDGPQDEGMKATTQLRRQSAIVHFEHAMQLGRNRMLSLLHARRCHRIDSQGPPHGHPAGDDGEHHQQDD